jgi:hypothetical protein
MIRPKLGEWDRFLEQKGRSKEIEHGTTTTSPSHHHHDQQPRVCEYVSLYLPAHNPAWLVKAGERQTAGERQAGEDKSE